MFALLGDNNFIEDMLTLKGTPDQYRAMVEQFDYVTEEYYAKNFTGFR